MTFDEIKATLSKKVVGIAGAGGLGSNCAVALARVGIGKLIIADFDVVTEGNLNRQYYFYRQIGMKKVYALEENIHAINPSIEFRAIDQMLDRENVPAIFNTCDLIVEAFDKADQKEMLIESILTAFPQIHLVVGLGMAGWGMNELIHYRRLGNLHVCGDEVTEISDESPPIAPRVGIVANMQANVVVELLLGSEVAK